MDVKHAVIHQVTKEQGTPDVNLFLANGILTIDETVIRVAEELKKLYKGQAIYGQFSNNDEVHRFRPNLKDCMDKDWANFYDFSKIAMSLLKNKLEQKIASAGGYVLFLHYFENEKEYFFVLMLNDKIGASVTENLALKKSIHLDLSKLYVAARINITLWESEEDHKYVSFIKGKRDISDYFIDFIGCTEVNDPKKDTDRLITILNEYMRNNKFSSDLKQEYRSAAATYLKECADEQRDASLKILSTRLNSDEPDSFYDYATDEVHEMSTFFNVDKSRLKKLTGIDFSQTGFKIKMSSEYVKNHVSINDNKLIIDNPPQKLKEDIENIK